MNQDKSFLEIIEEYVEFDKVTLPPFDKTALRVQQELQKKDVSVSRIEKLIVADPAMSSQVLKLSNSSFFRGLSKVLTIREAIVRLGLDEVTKTVMILSQKKLYATKDRYLQNYRKTLWQHSLVCALTSRWVAKEAGFENITQEVFFATLMHDIGKLFLITVMEKIQENKEIDFVPPKTVVNTIIRNQHAEQGFRLLEKWNIPEQYCEVARDHHLEKLDPSRVPLAVLRLVNKTSNKLGIAVEKKTDEINSVAAEASFFGFSEIKLAQLELQVEDCLKQVNEFYHV